MPDHRTEKMSGYVCFWCGQWNAGEAEQEYVLSKHFPTDREWMRPDVSIDPCHECAAAMRQGIVFIEVARVCPDPTAVLLRANVWATGRWLVVASEIALANISDTADREAARDTGMLLLPQAQFGPIYEAARRLRQWHG